MLFPPTRGFVRRRILRRATARQRTQAQIFVVDSEVVRPDPDRIVIDQQREDRD
jgi:hypothetical protein